MLKSFHTPEQSVIRTGVAFVGVIGLLGSAGCSEAGEAPRPATVTVRADIGPVLLDKTLCNSSGERPCSALVREAPSQDADLLNAERTQTTPVLWPIERYGSNSGDSIVVVCQVKGQKIFDTTNTDSPGHAFVIWDVIEVESRHLAASKQENVPKKQLSYGYVADLLMGNHGVYTNLPNCTNQQNSANAPAVK